MFRLVACVGIIDVVRKKTDYLVLACSWEGKLQGDKKGLRSQ